MIKKILAILTQILWLIFLGSAFVLFVNYLASLYNYHNFDHETYTAPIDLERFQSSLFFYYIRQAFLVSSVLLLFYQLYALIRGNRTRLQILLTVLLLCSIAVYVSMVSMITSLPLETVLEWSKILAPVQYALVTLIAYCLWKRRSQK